LLRSSYEPSRKKSTTGAAKTISSSIANKREPAGVRRKLNGLIDAIAEGLRARGLQKRLEELELRRAELEQET
jgi:hypothetical protein